MSAPGNVRAAEDTRADWETPNPLWFSLDREFDFWLDAAANEDNAKGDLPYLGPGRLYIGGRCLSNDAFAYDMLPTTDGTAIWCNPPYGRGLDRWAALFARWAELGYTVVALLPANTDTEWFRDLWLTASEIRFLFRRVQFVGTTSSNPGGSMVVIWRGSTVPGLLRTAPLVTLWDWRVPA